MRVRCYRLLQTDVYADYVDVSPQEAVERFAQDTGYPTDMSAIVVLPLDDAARSVQGWDTWHSGQLYRLYRFRHAPVAPPT